MYWAIRATGTIEGVRDVVTQAEPSLDEDRPSFERAREFILGELDHIQTNGVLVDAEGRKDRTRLIVKELDLALSTGAPHPPTWPLALEADAEHPLLTFISETITREDGAAVRPARSVHLP